MMLFLFVSPDDENPNKRPVGPIIAGAVVALVLGLGLALRSSPALLPVILVLVTLVGVGAIIYALAIAKSLNSRGEKPKRRQPGMDMYTMIDRMMDELDPDELDYLRRRVTERGGQSDGDLIESVNYLLDEREDVRGQQE
jgi:hypothetical protein